MTQHSTMYHKFRSLFVAAPFAERVDMQGKHVIVTGASPGSIGFEAARTLASWGATVTVTTRRNVEATVAALRTSSGGHVQGHVLDLTEAASVQRFASWYQQSNTSLDVLINNAGVHLDLTSQWQEPQLTADGFEIHWRTNYLGTLHLTSLLLPLLRQTTARTQQARIVNVLSMLHSRGKNAHLFTPAARYNSWDAYALSKLALMHHTFEMQRRYAAEGLQSYCLHPGAVFTNIASKGLSGSPLLSALRDRFAFVEAFFLMTPTEGAQTHLYCATQPDLPGGFYYRNCAPAQPSQESEDRQVATRLWEQTQQWLQSLDTSPVL